jgi:hypothetical protein
MVDDMIKEWYCMLAGRLEGPFSLQELRRTIEGGTLNPGDMVRRGEAGTWVAAGSVVEGVEERRTARPTPPPLPEVSREKEPRLALDAPFSEWGVAALVLGCFLLITTPLSVLTVNQIRVPGGSHFLSFVLFFVLEFFLFLGNGASVAFAVLGILSYVKQHQRLPLNLAGAVVSGLSLLLWLFTAVVLIRSFDRM